MLEDLIKSSHVYLPEYLTPEQKDDLFSELKRFPDNFNYYLSNLDETILMQGDGLSGFILLNFRNSDRKIISGVILSNSCDINTENNIPNTRKVIFAPLIKLNKYEELLIRTGRNSQSIKSSIDTIKTQKVTDILYLPAITGIIEESIVLLDDLHSMPINDFLNGEKSMLFRLSQSGFWFFLIKLSIHFTRIFEGKARVN